MLRWGLGFLAVGLAGCGALALLALLHVSVPLGGIFWTLLALCAAFGALITVSAFLPLRSEVPWWQSLLCGLLCVALVLAVWFGLTFGERSEDRLLSKSKLPSPGETFDRKMLERLWFERHLSVNTLVSLTRVIVGFSLATAIGVPIGIFCGCYTRITAFFAPITVFGRNIPMAALIPLSMTLFGTNEFQKVMFIFVAAVAFIIFDAAQAVRDVAERYIDTAYTLGAARGQIVIKVIVPLALPRIFNSLRLLFGLAFGYIMLAEVIQSGNEAGGLGQIISNSQRIGPREHILLILFVIPLVALAIDRLLFLIQKQLFPYRYGGAGYLALGVQAAVRGCGRIGEMLPGGSRQPPEAPPQEGQA